MIPGKHAPFPGEARFSWLTGTAAWSFYAATHYLLGVRPEYDGSASKNDGCPGKNAKSIRLQQHCFSGRFKEKDHGFDGVLLRKGQTVLVDLQWTTFSNMTETTLDTFATNIQRLVLEMH